MAQKKQIERKWLTQTEAAAYLNIDASTLWKFRKKGLLAFYKVGGHVFYSLAEIDAMILKGRNTNKQILQGSTHSTILAKPTKPR